MSKWVLFLRGIVAAMIGGLVLGVLTRQILPAIKWDDLTSVAAAGAAVCGLAYSFGHVQGVETERVYENSIMKRIAEDRSSSQSERGSGKDSVDRGER